MPVGFYQGKDKTFNNHDIQLEIGDTFYLFSDGFVDQKGGKENKKFMSKNFKNLLLDIHDQPMYDQKAILEKALTNWMGANSQMDDILVIGVRV
jgi:serine phosphatase RsbU (regulator of sigma subunit)